MLELGPAVVGIAVLVVEVVVWELELVVRLEENNHKNDIIATIEKLLCVKWIQKL